MGDTNISPPSTTGLDSEVAAISAKIMVTSMIVLFFIVGFCLFLCLYARWYWSRAGYPLSVSWRGQNASSTTVSDHRRGLDRDTLRALPVTVYDAKDFKEALECSVCLSEITQGENIRVLPKCSHGFHLECIDMWFMSHSTCPLCRNYVVNCPKTQSIESNNESQRTNNGPTNLSDTNLNLTVSSDETTVFPANVVESFKEASGSSTSRQMREELVIEIPVSTMQFSEDEMKTPVVSRLGSLKRMLSRGKRVAPSGSVDVEPV